jgi:hypothetical protein
LLLLLFSFTNELTFWLPLSLSTITQIKHNNSEDWTYFFEWAFQSREEELVDLLTNFFEQHGRLPLLIRWSVKHEVDSAGKKSTTNTKTKKNKIKSTKMKLWEKQELYDQSHKLCKFEICLFQMNPMICFEREVLGLNYCSDTFSMKADCTFSSQQWVLSLQKSAKLNPLHLRSQQHNVFILHWRIQIVMLIFCFFVSLQIEPESTATKIKPEMWDRNLSFLFGRTAKFFERLNDTLTQFPLYFFTFNSSSRNSNAIPHLILSNQTHTTTIQSQSQSQSQSLIDCLDFF